jgi:tetratricopeptide (TPR) repeat protein
LDPASHRPGYSPGVLFSRPATRAPLVALVFILTSSSLLVAQTRDRFTSGLIDFINAADAAGDRQAALTAAVDEMAAGLAEWDALIARVEAGLAADIGKVPPAGAARMRLALGAALLERGRFDAAVKQFDAGIVADPAVPDLHVFRGLALERLQRPAQAATAFRRAWEIDKNNAVNAYRFLRAARGTPASPQRTEAMGTLRRAVDAASAGGAAFTVVTTDLLDDAASDTPVIPLAVHADAFASIRSGQYDQAVARFRTALAAEAAGDLPAVARGAEGDLSAVARRAEVERARLAAADARVAAGDREGAARLLSETVKAMPASRRAQWKLGTLVGGFGDQRAAAAAFEAASPGAVLGAAPLYATLGRLHHARLDLDAAIAAHGRRVALRPNDAAAHYDLADVYRAADDLDAAMVEALAAALLDSGNARVFAMIGQLDAAAGRDADAVRMLQRAVSLAPADTESRYALSRALLRVGREEEARRELQAFQQLQAKAMDEERRRYQENMRKIDETLKAGESRDSQK